MWGQNSRPDQYIAFAGSDALHYAGCRSASAVWRLQVVALQLSSRHRHTAVCCARLPCSSVERQRAEMPRQVFPEQEFVVVATFEEQASADGLQRVQPQLAVFEIKIVGGRQAPPPHRLIAALCCIQTCQTPRQMAGRVQAKRALLCDARTACLANSRQDSPA